MEEVAVVENGEHDLMEMPPGFRFHPTDEEIITHYLTKKVMDERFTATAIEEVDINKCEPWDLAKRAKNGEKESFFFCKRDRKYPTGMRTNRATQSGYWKATGKDKEIYKDKTCLIGMKKTLVFYKGRAPKGEKTNWVMHEYRLEGRISHYNFPRSAKDEWFVCRVFHKNSAIRIRSFAELAGNYSFIDQILGSPTLPPLMEDLPSSSTAMPDSSFTHCEIRYDTDDPNQNIRYETDDPNQNISTYLNDFETSYQGTNSIFHSHTPIRKSNFIAYAQEFPNSSGFVTNWQSHVEQFSSNNSIISPLQDTEISSVISKRDNGNKSFEEVEALAAGHNISELETYGTASMRQSFSSSSLS